MKRFVALLAFIAATFSIYKSECQKVVFDYLSVDDGLSQGIIEDIYQDSQGFMWFSTRDGLNRFDGVSFTVFRNDRHDPNSLASSFVSALGEDINGNLWIGSSGLNIYEPNYNRMTRVPTDPDNPDAYHGGGRVYSILSDSDSTLWICSANGLVHYFPKTKKFRTYLSDGKQGSLGTSLIYSVCKTRNNRLYFGAGDDLIYEYDRTHDNFIPISYKLKYFGNNTNKFIHEDVSGLLYINSEFGGVHIYNPTTGQASLLDKAEGQLNVASVKTRVLQISIDEIWIGTDGGGINVYNPTTGSMKYLMADSKFPGTLSGNAIFKMYMDRDGNVWVGHFGTGLSVWKRNKEKFTSFIHNPLVPSSINKEVITAVFEDSNGRIWVGQDGGGLSLFNETDGTFDHIRRRENDPYSLTSDVILTINEDPEGNLLLGTYMGGFMVFDPDSRRVIKSFNAGNGLPGNHVWMIFPDSQGRYWVTFLTNGYALYDPAAKSFEHISLDSPLACAATIMHVEEDPQGRIWFGSETEGFCILDWDKQEIKSYRNIENEPNSLSYNDVKGFLFKDNYAWIATNGGGLNRLDLTTDSFKIYAMADGLSSDALMGILEDDKGFFWISSTRGIMKFNPETEEITLYDKSQGLPGNEFKYKAQLKLSDGRMAFGGVKGLTIFHPDEIIKSTVVPDIVFTDFKIYNVSQKVGEKNSPLTRNINLTERIRLKYNQAVFTFEFASLDYNSPYKNKFSYMLEGFDKEWIDAGNRRFATYTNLDRGKYTFLLRGSNSDGIWNPEARRIVVRVRPPWYGNLFSISIYIILIILGIIWYIRQREKKSIQDKLLLKQKIEEAQAELKSKTRKVEEHEKEIKRRDEEEKDIRFFNEGVAKMSDIIARKRQNLEELSSSIISELVSYVGASAGGIFVLDDTEQDHHILKASGDFCLSSDEDVTREFEIGEGNIGTCFKEKQTIICDNIPDGCIVLKSGLGKISLHNAVYIPIMQDNTPVGVIEMASIDKLSDNKVKFMEKIAESLASIITIIKANLKSNLMIEMNNTQAEELRAQEEEMRQNMEELLATQEESQRREKKIISEIEEKDKTILDLKKQLATLNKKQA